MNCGTRTDPYSQTRPTSLRPRSTSITCSARSFSLRFSSSARRMSSSSFRPRRRVPAIGCVSTREPSTRTSISGDEPTTRDAAHADEIHVRRRIHVAQRAVDGERVGARPSARTAATARPDRCRRRRCAPWRPGPASRTARGSGSIGSRRAGRRLGRALRQVAFQLALEELNLRAGELIERLEVFVRP